LKFEYNGHVREIFMLTHMLYKMTEIAPILFYFTSCSQFYFILFLFLNSLVFFFFITKGKAERERERERGSLFNGRKNNCHFISNNWKQTVKA